MSADPKLQRGEIRVLEGVDGFEETAGKVSENLYGRLDAHFNASDAPVFHTDVMSNGVCTLKKWVPSQCPGDFCDGICLAGVCKPYTSYVDVGNVKIEGLTLPVSMNPSMFGGNYYYLENATVPKDLHAPGDTITARVAGKGSFPALDFSVRAPAPLATSIVRHEITLTPHADARVTWTPGSLAGARVRLTLNANNKGHGQPYEAIIVCEEDDVAGSLTVPREMVDAFPATQAWQACVASDCPRSTIQRLSRGVVELPGGGGTWVSLTVGHEIGFGVVHVP